jgi:Alginate export
MRSLFVWLLLLCCGLPLAAQDDATPIQIGDVTFSGSVRERYEAWGWFEPAMGQNLYGFSGTLIRLALSQQRETFDWKLEFAVPVLLGIPDKAVQPAPAGQLGLGGSYYAANDKNQNTAFIFPKQAYVRFKDDNGSSFQAGRFEFMDAMEVKPKDPTLATLKNDRIGQRLIGTFGYSDVMRSFDGLHYAFNSDDWNFTVVSAIPTRGVFQVDGWGWVKTPVTYAAITHEINNGEGQANAEWRVFGIYYNDSRDIEKTDNRPASVRALDLSAINIGTYGGHVIAALPASGGTFDVLGWLALQNGSWGTQSQRASAFAGEAGFQPNIWERVRPWIRGGYFYSSGDGTPDDHIHGTFFAILPTPRVYARFPFFNEMNNRDLFEEIELRPGKNFTIRSDIHGLWLDNRHDLWYSGGGAFQPWTFGYQGRPSNGHTGLATLYDISGDYNFKHGISLGLYFGYAVGGPVIKSIYPKDSNGALGYTEFNYHF